MSRSDTRFALGLAAVAVGVGASIFSAIKAAKDEKERQLAIDAINAQIKKSYPKVLASYLITAFESSSFVPDFNFDGHVQKWYDDRLYKFLFFRMGEHFADVVLEKKDKIRKRDFEIPLTDLLDLSLRQVQYEGFSGTFLVDEFEAFLRDEDDNAALVVNDVSRELLSSILNDEKIKERRDDLIPRSNVFVTETGPVMITDDYRCVQIKGDEIIVFPELADYQKANRQSKKWEIVYDFDKKTALVGDKVDLISVKLYIQNEGIKA